MREAKRIIISEFNRIKSLGFVSSTRQNNRDGGIGNTFEDYLGVIENNLRLPDFNGFEVKSKRNFNGCFITLFSKVPTYPIGVNTILKEKYGQLRDPIFPEAKKFYASVFANEFRTIYSKFDIGLFEERRSNKLLLSIKDLATEETYDDVFWHYDDLEAASSKLKYLFVVSADEKTVNGERHYHFNKASIYMNFNFNKFLEALYDKKIRFDIRIGTHKTGNAQGRAHDHGSGFRVRKAHLVELYDVYLEVE